MEQKYIQTAIDYKKNIAGKFVLVEGAKLKQRVEGERLCVTRKIDGHLQVVFWQDGQVLMLNASGKQKAESLKCLDAFAEAMKAAGVKQAAIAAELYLPVTAPKGEDGRRLRPRCGDVIKALADDELKNQLCLAPFDIIELDGEPWKVAHYSETHNKLCTLFGPLPTSPRGGDVCPVPMRNASSHDEVQAFYDEWVVGEGAEGLVVHSESPIVWKVKPRHTIDAAVIGYTTTTSPSGEPGGGRIRDLMFAVCLGNSSSPKGEAGRGPLFQMFAIGSTGLTDEQRADIAQRLSTKHAESQYVLSDSRGIAYQMVRPELVFEISVLELVARGNDDKVRTNPLLRYDDAAGWLMEGTTPGVSVLGVTIDRERTDKQPNEVDVRISQLTDITPFEKPEGESALNLQPSTLLERHVYKKVSGSKVMLHKFLLWKTNKEQSGRYPAYVVYHTDFSSGRKDMLKRDMAYSDDEQQIRDILAAEIADNVKKGWEEV